MISVIDYGLGNIIAFVSAYQRLGIGCEIVSNPEDLKKATHIVLPGVGSFEGAMKKIHDSGFHDLLTELVIEKEIKVLGVCLGLQIMGTSSEEAPGLPGLGWLEAETIKISNMNLTEQISKIPLMGWNKIIKQKECQILDGLDEKEFYFLHSYNLKTKFGEDVSSFVDLGENLTASIASDNIFGTQFHPEKSHSQGLKLLRNFALI